MHKLLVHDLQEKLSDDFDREPIIDMYRMYLSEQRREPEDRFIRDLSVAGFRAILFRNSQLEAFDELRRLQHGNVVAHLDATGGLVNALPREIEGTTKVFSYVISISSPKPKGAPLTMAEFILNQHDGLTIQRCLESFITTFFFSMFPHNDVYSTFDVVYSIPAKQTNVSQDEGSPQNFQEESIVYKNRDR